MEHTVSPTRRARCRTDALSTIDEARPRAGRANEIRAALQEEIESGRLPPGSPLDERALALRFQVSRTPVREALQQLLRASWCASRHVKE
jgi:DNA-binding GntR family transcriptional regulator